jgi:transposase-like protein
MTAGPSIDMSGWLHEHLEQASPDLLRAMVRSFAEALMSAEADAVCGAGYGERSEERANPRNGYRRREWDTRAGSVDLQVPKLRQGSYFPGWLLERRRRAEAALVSVVATSYLLGVSTWRVEKLIQQLGITQLSKSQVSEMARDLSVQKWLPGVITGHGYHPAQITIRQLLLHTSGLRDYTADPRFQTRGPWRRRSGRDSS